MSDPGENILSYLPTVCAVTGIAAVERNKRDASGLTRPAAIILDGAEARREMEKNIRFSEVQMMDLLPVIRIYVRADNGPEAGAILRLFRGRIVKAVLSNTTLKGYVGTNGDIRFEDWSMEEPEAEPREFRGSLTMGFTYPFRLSDLS